ncbi:restriction endonuclease subunit S [Nocardia vinacea]|uniref:restriction endonuclease subunit S n=1 Tax=Nocardia vinacea TaxID=96468 RepID=UPI002E159A91|nr:restriction endonuclease subunit S [Nocardia vinacea]
MLKTSSVYGGVFNPTENKEIDSYDLDRVSCPVLAGSLIVSRMNTKQHLGVAAAVRQDFANLYLPDRLWAVTFRGAEPRFIDWWTKTPAYRSQVEAVSVGTSSSMQNISQGDFLDLRIELPDLEAQRAIADYLDRETDRIDALIEEQQRLIEMLRERREATIRSALLSGLDDAETAPSGVELLGAVPKHWRMVPTRYLCTITTGSEDSGNATDGGEYPFYVRGREVLRIDHYSFEGEAVMTPGDGQGGTGKVFHYFDGKFEAHQRVYVFTDFTDVTGWYFYYFLSTFLRPVALAGSNTVTMESLRRPLLADFKVAVPPIYEQQRITAYLDDQTAKIDTLIAEAEHFIDLARERRSALITAAVTGQIDVRAMA